MTPTDKKLTHPAKPPPSQTLQVRELLGRFQVDIEVGGHVDFSRQLSNSLHRHNYYEICYVTGGQGDYQHGSVRYKLSSGDVFVADPGVLHEISSYGAKNLTLYHVRFSVVEVGIDAIASSFDEPGARDFDRFFREHRIHTQTDGALRYFVHLLDSSTLKSEQLLGLFTIEMLKTLLTAPSSAPENHSVSEFDALFAYIDSHQDRKLTCQEIADFAGLSERTLRRRFKTVTGTTLGAEIDHRRMRSAAHRLLGGATVREVADSLGDMDPAQFHRSFTRIFGMSPKKFQQTYMPGSWKQTRP